MTTYPYTLTISGTQKLASLTDSDNNSLADRLTLSWSDNSVSYSDTYQIGWLDATHWYAYDGVGNTPLGSPLLVSGAVSGDSGNLSYTASVVSASANHVVVVGKEGTYTTISSALQAASDGDIILVGSGRYAEDITITKSVTLLGANHGLSAVVNDSSGNPIPDIADNVRANDETWIDGTVTVKTHDVEINGFRLHNIDGPLKFDHSVLADSSEATSLDNLTLVNNFITGYYAGSAPTLGTQGASATNATGWTIADNFIGGVITDSGHYGSGSLYLSGLADSTISDNAFWRPAAAHLYLSTLTNVTIDGNNFYHGLHASGADFDGYADEFYGSVAYGEGYGAYGSSYSSGYGTAYGYGDTGYGYGESYGETYFGRNYWFELKGVNDGVYITGNEGSYNSGGIQFYGETSGYSFDDIVISGNTFENFVNADPNGTLTDEESRHLSGLMGAINISVNSGATASDILIQDNIVTIGADQVYSAYDVSGLIQVTGYVSDLVVLGNDLNWVASETINYQGITVPATTYFNTAGKVLEGVGLYAGLDGKVYVAGNDISFTTAKSLATEVGLYISNLLSSGQYGTYGADTLVTGDNTVSVSEGDTSYAEIVLANYSGTQPPSNFTIKYILGDQTPLLISMGGSWVPLTSNGVLASPYAYQANEVPLVLNEIEDEAVSKSSIFSYHLPSGTFVDIYPENSTLSYTAAMMANGITSALPSWLTFDAATGTFTGTPTGTGATSVKVTAQDSSGKNTSEYFDFLVLDEDANNLVVQAKYWKSGASIEGVSVGSALSSANGNAVLSYTAGSSSVSMNPSLTLNKTGDSALSSGTNIEKQTEKAINTNDAFLILNSIAQKTALNDYQKVAANFNGDNKIDINDVIDILKHEVGLTAPQPSWVFDQLDASLTAYTEVEVIGILRGDVDGSWSPY